MSPGSAPTRPPRSPTRSRRAGALDHLVLVSRAPSTRRAATGWAGTHAAVRRATSAAPCRRRASSTCSRARLALGSPARRDARRRATTASRTCATCCGTRSSAASSGSLDRSAEDDVRASVRVVRARRARTGRRQRRRACRSPPGRSTCSRPTPTTTSTVGTSSCSRPTGRRRPAVTDRRSTAGRRHVKLVNTHMHLMEAMTAAHRVDLDPRATVRAVELVDVLATRAVRRRCGAPVTDAWSADWHARERDRTVRYGHLLELAWMLVDSADAVGVHSGTAARATGERMPDYVPKFGTDPERRDLAFGAGRSVGRRRRYEWWAQAEALMAYAWHVCVAPTRSRRTGSRRVVLHQGLRGRPIVGRVARRAR